MKNPSNYPIKSFARLKKITTLIFKKSVALIVKTDLPKINSIQVNFIHIEQISSDSFMFIFEVPENIKNLPENLLLKQNFVNFVELVYTTFQS